MQPPAMHPNNNSTLVNANNVSLTPIQDIVVIKFWNEYKPRSMDFLLVLFSEGLLLVIGGIIIRGNFAPKIGWVLNN